MPHRTQKEKIEGTVCKLVGAEVQDSHAALA